MIWRGKQLSTMGEIGDMTVEIAKSGTRAEALAFMEAYKDATEYAYPNVLYYAGYYDPQTAMKVRQMFRRPESEAH
jgi:hypothetical protein